MEYCLKDKQTDKYVIAKVKLTEGPNRDEKIAGRIAVEGEDFVVFYTTFESFYDEWEIVGAQNSNICE